MQLTKKSKHRVYIIVYLLIFATLICGLIYYVSPRYYYRGIKLHTEYERVIEIEKDKNQSEPSSQDKTPTLLHYKDITLASDVTATIDYTFSNDSNPRLVSIFIQIPIKDDNKENVIKYLTSTFQTPKDTTDFTLDTSHSYNSNGTRFSLFHADNSNSYCIQLRYQFEKLLGTSVPISSTI